MNDRELIPQELAFPLLGGLITGILILGIYFFAVHQPQSKQYDEKQERYEELLAERDSLRVEASGRDSALLALNRLCDLRDDRLNQLPTVPDRNQVRFAIEEFARRAEFDNISAEWNPPEREANRTIHALVLTGRGTFDAAQDFLQFLKLHDHDIGVASLDFYPPTNNGGGRRTYQQPELRMTWELALHSANTEQRNGGQWCQLAQDDAPPEPNE
jgi:nitrogen fixation-related uncharacterized protein